MKTTFKYGFPKIRKYYTKIGNVLMKYKVGRDDVGWWSLAENLPMAIKIWFKYL